MDKLSLATYNCKHFRDTRVAYCKKLLDICSIIFLQEHCLYEKQLNELQKLGEVLYHGVSSMDDSVPLLGRPYGGLQLFGRMSWMLNLKPLKVNAIGSVLEL